MKYQRWPNFANFVPNTRLRTWIIDSSTNYSPIPFLRIVTSKFTVIWARYRSNLRRKSWPFSSKSFGISETYLLSASYWCELDFRTLADDLSFFPEEVVARQFAMLILSRLVLLNESAQKYLLPRVFTVKNGSEDISAVDVSVRMFITSCVYFFRSQRCPIHNVHITEIFRAAFANAVFDTWLAN